jgi:hypothetical protein
VVFCFAFSLPCRAQETDEQRLLNVAKDGQAVAAQSVLSNAVRLGDGDKIRNAR